MVFHIATGNAPTTYRGLMDRTIEVAIARAVGPLLDKEVLRVEKLFDDTLVVAAGARNPLAKRRRIELAELLLEKWVMPLPDSVTTALAAQAFRERGLEPPEPTVMTPSLNVRNRLLMTAGFLTFTHGFAHALPSKPATIVPLAVAMPSTRRPIAIITLKKRVLSPLAEYFIKHMRDIAQPFAKSK